MITKKVYDNKEIKLVKRIDDYSHVKALVVADICTTSIA